MVTELCHLSLAAQAGLVRERKASPVEVVASCLRQIERVEPHLNAFITLLAQQAMDEARSAEQEIVSGRHRGPLHGLPIGLKDLINTRGIRTTVGSKIMADYVPDRDATVVRRLREAGAIVVGKLNLHEFAYGPTGTNPHYGNVHNPWDLERIPGGSSSGSGAAVAARMVSGALGTDTGGSIRIPSALCGVTGLKPTYGLVSRDGTFPCAWSLDHIGPMCRTAEDAALLLQGIAGWDPNDPASARSEPAVFGSAVPREVAGRKMAILREYVEDACDEEVRSGFSTAVEVLRQLGAEIHEVSVPEATLALGASTAIQTVECSEYHEENLRRRADDYGPDVRERLEAGLLVSGTDYVRGQRIRRLLAERFRALFQQYSAVLCPMLPVTAYRLDEETVMLAGQQVAGRPVLVSHTRLFNLLGTPAVSVPSGFTRQGLPYAFQIGTAAYQDMEALAIAHAFQQATDYHKRVPAVAT